VLDAGFASNVAPFNVVLSRAKVDTVKLDGDASSMNVLAADVVAVGKALF